MKVSKHSVAIVAALTLAGAIALPGRSGATPVNQLSGATPFNQLSGAMPFNQVEAIDAQFVATRAEVQNELNALNQRLEAGRKASFYSAKASSEYLEATRDFDFGFYDEALAHARSGENALPAIPNWVGSASASR